MSAAFSIIGVVLLCGGLAIAWYSLRIRAAKKWFNLVRKAHSVMEELGPKHGMTNRLLSTRHRGGVFLSWTWRLEVDEVVTLFFTLDSWKRSFTVSQNMHFRHTAGSRVGHASDVQYLMSIPGGASISAVSIDYLEQLIAGYYYGQSSSAAADQPEHDPETDGPDALAGAAPESAGAHFSKP